jgi:tRNA(His) 5'-end guanylyltransferase
MFDTDLTLKDRMKALQAERDYRLDDDSYILCHIDGRAFSKMIKKKFRLPFDDDFMDMMDDTASYVCANVQGAKLAYVQSDEITIVITNFKVEGDEVLKGSSFFDYRLCKLQSIIASLATAKFNQLYTSRMIKQNMYKSTLEDSEDTLYSPSDCINLIMNTQLIQFDCKCWDIKEYNDMFAWFKFRQNDCIRNSKQQFAQAYCPHKELLNKNADEQVTYCKIKTGKDWTGLQGKYKYGRLVYRTTYPTQTINPKTGEPVNIIRSCYSAWTLDNPFTFDEFKSWELVPYRNGEV